MGMLGSDQKQLLGYFPKDFILQYKISLLNQLINEQLQRM